MQNQHYKIMKLCVLGDLGVGKTSLTSRFVTEHFVQKYKPTYQACHYHKYLQTPDQSVYIQVWDTSGTERFRSVSPHLVRDSHGILLVYDVTNLSSFASLHQYWINWVQEIAPNHPRVILVGNKVDRSTQRQIEHRVAQKFAVENDMLFYETSAKSGHNVDVVFLDGVNLLADTMDSYKSDSVSLMGSREHLGKTGVCCV